MRSCKFTSTRTPGRTKIVNLDGDVFRNHQSQELHDALHTAERVTVTFADQKNGLKRDKQTHQKTGDNTLCPVIGLASIIERIRRTIPTATGLTAINAFILNTTNVNTICSILIREQLRTTCCYMRGKAAFGYEASKIGMKSIRSGAAVSLFLINHPVHKIMILGRWSSNAFLVYIRPQVLEWTNNMSTDMIHLDTFFNATDPR